MLFGNNTHLEERVTYLSLTGLFISLFTAFSFLQRKQGQKLRLSPFEFILLALATFRLGRLAAYDKVAEPIRKPFTETVPDASGAGRTVVPRGQGVRRALGGLISCPICAGTWAAAAMVYGLQLAPGPTHVFMTIMSAIGAGELLNAATEAFHWTSQAERARAGEYLES